MSVDAMREVKAVCIGSQTADEALKHGFINVVIAEQATLEAIIQAVLYCS